MGWVNYVKIPELKLLIEVNKNADEPYYEDNFKIMESEDDWIELDEKYNELSLQTLNKLINYYENSPKLCHNDELLMYWLKGRNLEFHIISEYELSDNKKEYKDWYKISRNYNLDSDKTGHKIKLIK